MSSFASIGNYNDNLIGEKIPYKLDSNVYNSSNSDKKYSADSFPPHIFNNLSNSKNPTIVDNYDAWKHNNSHQPIFTPTSNLSNIYGTNHLCDNYHQDKIQKSNYHNNTLPAEQFRVGPGLNKGYTHLPSGGINQSDKWDYIRPKNIDELRRKNNPQISYTSRPTGGKSKVDKPQMSKPVHKNRPERVWDNPISRWLKTLGAYRKNKIHPKLIVKETNRIVYREHIGHAKNSTNKHIISSENRTSRRNIYEALDIGHAHVKTHNKHDYGKNAIQEIRNEREVTESRTNILNFTGSTKNQVYDPNDVARTTIKETTVDNDHAGNFDSVVRKNQVYDPNDVARTTIKETTIDNDHAGNFDSVVRKNQVYDPNDVARTTIKETTIDNDHAGNFDSVVRKNQVYDPNDVARTTIKETTINNDHAGNFDSVVRKNQVYDPNDVARTTIKETTINNDHTGNFDSVVRKNQVYDPNDVARTTIKETTIDNDHTGNFGSATKKPTVYDPDDIARTTVKETTIDNTHIGNINTQETGNGYLTSNYEAMTTLRETLENINTNRNCNINVKKLIVYDPDEVLRTTVKETTLYEDNGNIGNLRNTTGYLTANNHAPDTHAQYSHVDYKGTAISFNKKEIDDTQYKNARTNAVREDTLVGREPTNSSTKMVNGDINVNINKIESDYINERVPNIGVSYNVSLCKNDCTTTNIKSKLDDAALMKDRINPYVVSSLKSNPYMN